MEPEQHDGAGPGDEAPSKSARKRAHKALQTLGDELMRLSAAQLERVPLPGDVREAVVAGRALRKGARSRHVRHLGNMLSRTDDAPVREALDAIRGAGALDTARLHRAERWRERLIQEGDQALAELVAQFPQTDRQRVRMLARAAREERDREAPPRRARELLRALRALEEAAD